ncbi:MAG: hypothetical protein AAF748_08440 [Pseudomonadota bacterium]
MIAEGAIEAALSGLDALLDELTLPPRTTQTIERLGERLATPVRIALIGPGGAGKSTLLNVLAGEAVLPTGVTLPTTQVQYAPEPMLAVTVADGSRRGFDALDFEAALRMEPLFLEVALPAERLRRIGLLEMDCEGSEEEMRAAGRWVAKRAEMALWVTRGFDHLQQKLWRTLPQSLRDHAFLVLNGIDDYTSSDLRGRIEAHESFARDEFLGVVPVSAEKGFAGMYEETPDDALRAAGCMTLLEVVFGHISQGRQADIDAAAMYLQRFGRDLILPETGEGEAAITQPTRLIHSPQSKPIAPLAMAPVDAVPASIPAMAADTPTPEEAAPPTAPVEVKAGDDDVSAKEPEPEPEAAAAPNFYLKRIGMFSGDEDSGDQDAALSSPAAFGEAVDQIEVCATDLLRQMDGDTPPVTETVLQCCLETVEALSDFVGNDAALRETVFQASDYLLLLQLEPDAQPEDAIAAMMQIKRECEVSAAR